MESKTKVVYQTKVKEIGSDAKDFSEIKMAILFGEEAPDALRSSCYIIEVNPIESEIVVGMYLLINNKKYQITAVGNEVQRNLGNLGHIAISFTNKDKAELSGTLYVEEDEYPSISVGDRIEIVEN